MKLMRIGKLYDPSMSAIDEPEKDQSRIEAINEFF
jgi:hypothetical protein